MALEEGWGAVLKKTLFDATTGQIKLLYMRVEKSISG
jgi:hypothetical protein